MPPSKSIQCGYRGASILVGMALLAASGPSACGLGGPRPPAHVASDDKADRTRVVRRIPPGPDDPLGARWIAFAHGDGWTVGLHGTPHPELPGRAVSGGRVRMRNADVVRIYDRVQLGTPVVVEP